MAIIYSVVARGPTILADHAAMSGNFTTIAPMILEKIATNRNEKRSYGYGDYIWHYMVQDGLIFMAMADQGTHTVEWGEWSGVGWGGESGVEWVEWGGGGREGVERMGGEGGGREWCGCSMLGRGKIGWVCWRVRV